MLLVLTVTNPPVALMPPTPPKVNGTRGWSSVFAANTRGKPWISSKSPVPRISARSLVRDLCFSSNSNVFTVCPVVVPPLQPPQVLYTQEEIDEHSSEIFPEQCVQSPGANNDFSAVWC